MLFKPYWGIIYYASAIGNRSEVVLISLAESPGANWFFSLTGDVNHFLPAGCYTVKGEDMVGNDGICSDHSGNFHVTKSTSIMNSDYWNEMAAEYGRLLERIFSDLIYNDVRVMF